MSTQPTSDTASKPPAAVSCRCPHNLARSHALHHGLHQALEDGAVFCCWPARLALAHTTVPGRCVQYESSARKQAAQQKSQCIDMREQEAGSCCGLHGMPTSDPVQ